MKYIYVSLCLSSIGKALGDEVMKVIVNLNGTKKEFIGKGNNTVCAKRAGAKLALKKLGYTKFVI